MQAVSIMRIKAHGLLIAAGTSPPLVTATIPLKGHISSNLQARAFDVRCNSSQETGKLLF